MSFYTDTELNFNQGVLSYNACKNIYRSSKMGRRVIEKLVDFAMSAERDINIQKAPPEAVKQFKDTAKFLEQEESIKQCLYLSRIYGTGALYMALYDKEEEENDYTTKPNFENAERYKIKFTALDPMNISGSRVDLDPASFNFLEVIDIKINSKPIPKKRIAVVHALKPLYLDNRTSLIPFTPPSVFYNMVDLLKDYDNAIEALDNLLYKAGAIIYKYPAKSKISGVLLNSIQASANILEQKKNGSVIAISNDSSIEDFPINNVSGLIDSLNKLENAITAALNDTPATILFDKSLSNGFSEGDKDKETEISTIETFRENKLKPLYTLTDYYVMLSAWDNTFIEEMKAKYPALQYKTNAGIFREWAESFTYEFGNLFPEPESVKQDNNAKKLDNLKRAKELGANLSDLEEELNESGIFTNEITLDESNLENEAEGEEEEANFTV